MSTKIDANLIQMKVQLIKETLGKDFLSEYHTQYKSTLQIAINNRYSIYKYILLSFDYKVDNKDESKFIWKF